MKLYLAATSFVSVSWTTTAFTPSSSSSSSSSTSRAATTRALVRNNVVASPDLDTNTKSASSKQQRPIYDPLGLYPDSSTEYKEGRIQQLESTSWLEQKLTNKPVVDSMGLYPKDSPEYIESLQLEREYSGIGVGNNNVNRPINDPMRLYTDSTQERLEGRVPAMEPREQTTSTSNKNVMDPLGLYPRNSAEYETSMAYEKEMRSMSKQSQRELYDPLGLYTASSQERQEGAIRAVEPPFEAIKPVLDPMNLYQPGQRDEISGGGGANAAATRSEALPFLQRPTVLDGSLAGDVGFDPLGFSKTPTDLAFYRQAELKHARIAMLAAAGWPLSELWDKPMAAVLHLKPLLVDGDRVPSLLNGGLSHVNPFYWMGVLALAGLAEGIQMMTTNPPLSSNNVGGWGVTFNESTGGPAFDPLNLFPKDAAGQRRMELAEIKNGRLAMLAITAFAVMEAVTKTAVVESTPFFFHPPF
jgi:Chlorophyll A-B binding protein